MANIVNRRNPAPMARRSGEWDPFERMRDLMQWNPFQELPRWWLSDEGGGYTPRFDVREEENAFMIQADLPGIKESDVDITISGSRLTISGKREQEKIEEEKSYYTRERSYGTFSRSFTLPENIDSDHIEASMQDGVLELRIPKSAESRAKRIPLRTGGTTGRNGGERAGSSRGEESPSQRAS